jgi:hypothetical protein
MAVAMEVAELLEEGWLWMVFWERGWADFEEDGSLSSSEASGLTV